MAVASVDAATSALIFADASAGLSKIGVTSGGRPVLAAEALLRKSTESPLISGDLLLDRSAAAVVVAGGLAAGFDILTTLTALAADIQRAIDNGLTSPETQTFATLSTIDTNVPTARIRDVIAALDNLVGGADINGANLISSTAGPVIVRTTKFGGRLTVQPLPLDAEGLGLTGLTALSVDEATAALATVQAAIVTAQSRVNSLIVLQNSIGLASAVSQSLVEATSAGNSGLLPPGSLVNLVA